MDLVGACVGDVGACVGDVEAFVDDVEAWVGDAGALMGDVSLGECALERVVLSCAIYGCCEVSTSSYHMSATMIIMPCHEPKDPVPRKPCTKTSKDMSWNVLSQMFGTVMKRYTLSALIILFQREKILGLLSVKLKFFFLFFF